MYLEFAPTTELHTAGKCSMGVNYLMSSAVSREKWLSSIVMLLMQESLFENDKVNGIINRNVLKRHLKSDNVYFLYRIINTGPPMGP